MCLCAGLPTTALDKPLPLCAFQILLQIRKVESRLVTKSALISRDMLQVRTLVDKGTGKRLSFQTLVVASLLLCISHLQNPI
jgi:hypothetical protein